MSEVLVRYTATVRGDDGEEFIPQVCGGVADDGLWEAWIEFVSPTRSVRTGRETEQPNRDALMYWAQGLTATYLEGALVRATREPVQAPLEPSISPVFERPAGPPGARPFKPQRAILNPFTTFDEGEDLLRGQLMALSHDNLTRIVEEFQLGVPAAGDAPKRELVESMVTAVRSRSRAA